MSPVQSPIIVRQPSTRRWVEPKLHIGNVRRRFNTCEQIHKLSILQLCLVILGLAGISCFTCTLVDKYLYQSFQNWAFDQGITGRVNVTFLDYLRESTYLSFLLRRSQVPSKAEVADASQKPATASSTRPPQGTLLGRLEIERLHLSAAVREGVDDKVLRVAVGHVPTTALAGQQGNFAVAAHRDTLFHALKDIKSSDAVIFQASDGTAYHYRVAATQIVKPSDIDVLRSDGGGLIIGGGSVQGVSKLLTIITCYPFSYTGFAPQRFIVEARLIEDEEDPETTAPATLPDVTAGELFAPMEAESIQKTSVHAAAHRRRRGSKMRHVPRKHAVKISTISNKRKTPRRKSSANN